MNAATEHTEPRRRIATFGGAQSERVDALAATDDPFGPPHTRHVLNGANMVELLRQAVRGAVGNLLLSAQSTAYGVRLGAVASPHGDSGALAIRVTRLHGDFTEVDWAVRMTATVWFNDSRGVYGFQARIATGTRTELRLDLPTRVVRYARRRDERRPLGDANGVRVTLVADDGLAIPALAVVDLSLGGLGIELPDDIDLPLNEATQIQLQLGPRLTVEVMVAPRNTMDTRPGVKRHGLQFLAPSHALLLAVGRVLSAR